GDFDGAAGGVEVSGGREFGGRGAADVHQQRAAGERGIAGVHLVGDLDRTLGESEVRGGSGSGENQRAGTRFRERAVLDGGSEVQRAVVDREGAGVSLQVDVSRAEVVDDRELAGTG